MIEKKKKKLNRQKNIDLRKDLMMSKCFVEEIFLPPLDAPYFGGHWLILSVAYYRK